MSDKKDIKIIDITDDVKWIGILDYDIKTFDIVMTTEYGTTYNSYFINAEKKTLVEVAKEKFLPVYLEKLKTLTDPSDLSLPPGECLHLLPYSYHPVHQNM